jgi:hypothetical protein
MQGHVMSLIKNENDLIIDIEGVKRHSFLSSEAHRAIRQMEG